MFSWSVVLRKHFFVALVLPFLTGFDSMHNSTVLTRYRVTRKRRKIDKEGIGNFV